MKRKSRHSFPFTVRYNMDFLRDDIDIPHLFADSYLVKLMKDFDVVYLGVETEISTGNREHYFRAIDLDVLLSALGEFSSQDDDFKKSFMSSYGKGEGALSMEYTTEPYRPFSKSEIEYSNVSMSGDPRDVIRLIEDHMAMDDNQFAEECKRLGIDAFDDDFGDN